METTRQAQDAEKNYTGGSRRQDWHAEQRIKVRRAPKNVETTDSHRPGGCSKNERSRKKGRAIFWHAKAPPHVLFPRVPRRGNLPPETDNPAPRHQRPQPPRAKYTRERGHAFPRMKWQQRHRPSARPHKSRASASPLPVSPAAVARSVSLSSIPRRHQVPTDPVDSSRAGYGRYWKVDARFACFELSDRANVRQPVVVLACSFVTAV